MKLSVIIPAFNAESFIRRCVDMLVTIPFAEDLMEIICVDDCSTDNTKNIILNLQEIYSGKVKSVLLNKNRGWGGARMAGLEVASGDYVWFVDADDGIVPKVVSALLERAQESNVDILCFNFRDRYDNNDEYREYPVFKDLNVLSGLEIIRDYLSNTLSFIIGYVWRFFYKRQFLLDNHLSMPENECWEDTVFVPEALLAADRVICVSDIAYEYWHHTSSVCNVFGRTYPGHLLYDWVFKAGAGLLGLAKNVDDKDVSIRLKQIARNEYLNYFPIYLLRETGRERREFYRRIYDNYLVVKRLFPEMKFLSVLLLRKPVAPLFASILSGFYKLSHRTK